MAFFSKTILTAMLVVCGVPTVAFSITPGLLMPVWRCAPENNHKFETGKGNFVQWCEKADENGKAQFDGPYSVHTHEGLVLEMKYYRDGEVSKELDLGCPEGAQAMLDESKLQQRCVKSGKLGDTIVHGKAFGWHRNGELRSIENFQNDLQEGTQEFWYPNGQKSREVSFSAGTASGTETKWNPDGTILSTTEWKEGVSSNPSSSEKVQKEVGK